MQFKKNIRLMGNQFEFTLIDDQRSNYASNKFLTEELRNIIDSEKYVIIDLSVNKTIKAVKGSLKYGLVLNSFFRAL